MTTRRCRRFAARAPFTHPLVFTRKYWMADRWRTQSRTCGSPWQARCWYRRTPFSIRHVLPDYLMHEAQRLGARLYSRKVLSAKAGKVCLDDGTNLHGARIVNACGAEAGELLPGLPIRKRKGHLVITDRYPGFVRHQLVELGYLKSAHSLTGRFGCVSTCSRAKRARFSSAHHASSARRIRQWTHIFWPR